VLRHQSLPDPDGRRKLEFEHRVRGNEFAIVNPSSSNSTDDGAIWKLTPQTSLKIGVRW